ncbi:gamma-glutamylcyclotransferase family protein [Alteromonas lipolytica]|uniref:Putative gamma-glutamylcyclotransferase n=1 Tax=Alteromonas lipolytica TaxID=1856405 RepID=A0A1E8F8A0_9ALTE|nr:gamma-glutamylcyclotransferase family protein [Alteromonas lipolytica]OFI32147.1 hypothetical protein BFC17_07930 [Alteromonas lipolytica]GGF83494.1 hypothetical protein GCM10011338_39810 [Alteromonas lipolytica]
MRFTGKQPFFCYGTLLLARYQRLLFAQRLPVTPATLYGWRMRLGYDGYRYISPAPHHRVTGGVIWLTPQQQQAADRWEDVPYYRRESLRVKARSRILNVQAYTRRFAKGRSCPPQLYSTHSAGRLTLRPFR